MDVHSDQGAHRDLGAHGDLGVSGLVDHVTGELVDDCFALLSRDFKPY